MMIYYIETLANMINGEIKKGTDETKVMELPIPEKYNDYLIGSLYKMNLRFLYHKLATRTTQEP